MSTNQKMNAKNFDIDLEFGEVWEERVRKIFENKGTIEVKTERDIWRTTGNIVIEIGYKGRPSGLSITDAEWWIHVLTSSGEFHTALIFKVKKLRQTVTELVTTGKADIMKGGDNNQSELVRVPLKELFNGKSD
jgi:hypothetical protein